MCKFYTCFQSKHEAMPIKYHGSILHMSQRGTPEANVAGNADLGLDVIAIAGGSATDLQVSNKKRTGSSK